MTSSNWNCSVFKKKGVIEITRLWKLYADTGTLHIYFVPLGQINRARSNGERQAGKSY
jgi:hypothetical protein